MLIVLWKKFKIEIDLGIEVKIGLKKVKLIFKLIFIFEVEFKDHF